MKIRRLESWVNRLYKLTYRMAPHSSTLAWKVPRMEEPGRLQSMGSLRVKQDWATSLSLFTFMHWRRKWQPTPVFLPRESQGRGSLVGCRLWGRTESDTTEAKQQQQQSELRMLESLLQRGSKCLFLEWLTYTTGQWEMERQANLLRALPDLWVQMFIIFQVNMTLDIHKKEQRSWLKYFVG